MSPFERLRGAHLTSHPVLEDLVFSVLSLLVLVVAITVITANQDPRIVAVAAPGSPGAKQIVLYGTLVDQNGQPIPNAEIEISYAKNNRIASARTNADGEFSIRFNAATSPYTIRVTTSQGTATTTLDMTQGMTWGVRITMTPPSSWVFVPLPGY